MIRSRSSHRPTLACAAVTLALLAGCAQPPAQAPTVAVVLQGAVATSVTSVLLTLADSEDPSKAADATHYHITGSDGRSLGVLAAYPVANTHQVLLATAPQSAGTYSLKLDDAAAVTFTGSKAPTPELRSALALNTTQVLLRFALPDGSLVRLHSAAEQAGLYHLLGPNVTAAKLSVDKSAVVLTTAPQDQTVYRIQTSGVYTEDFALATGEATFSGMAGQDVTPPRVMEANAPDRQTVLVRFNEPITTVALENFSVLNEGNMPLKVTAAAFTDEFRTEARLTTEPQQDGNYVVQVRGLSDGTGNPLDPAGSSARFTGAGALDTTPPMLRGVQSTSSTSLTVTFSEPVRGGISEDGAENPANYTIQGVPLAPTGIKPQGGSSNLRVTAAKLSTDQRSVILTTLEQADIQYELSAVNIRDLVGNVIDNTTGTQRQKIVFRGSPPTGVDTDGDGLSDSVEQAGWKVTVTLPDGRKEVREVTSDPTNPDTDGDCLNKADVNDSCLTDRDERSLGLDPRSRDTDSDGLGDSEEYNLVFSDPLMMDSDSDGLGDGAEYSFFKTSPTLADTDGDQFKDGDEINTSNRDPLIADLPRLQIKIGDIALTLDESYTYTDRTGKSQTVSDSTSTNLEQSRERKYGTSDSATLTSTIEASVNTKISAEFPKTFGVSVEASLKGSEQREYNTTTSTESSARATEAYNQSLAKAQTFDASSEVTRTVKGAAMRLAVTLANDSNTAYTVKNLEITALEQNPFDRASFTPVATLVPEVGQVSGGQSGAYNLGPLVSALGPFLFKNSDVFPKTIENLMREPHGLVFRIANYDITDEAGRNFAFASREAYDRTAQIVVDFGNGQVLRYRVATNGVFDGRGKAKGITMKYALSDILGLDYATGQVPYESARVLTRVKDVSNQPGSHKAWTLLSSKALDPQVNFDDIVLKGGDSYSLAFLEDVDQDKLFASEEYLYGSSDQCINSDGNGCSSAPAGAHDSLSDFQEVREGWLVQVIGKTVYRAFSDPRRADSDNDGLLDDVEKTLGTDPRKRDTDEDGISDAEEVQGFTMRYKGAATPTDGVKTNPLNPDTDGDGLTDGFERKLGSNPNAADATKFVDSDQDGLSDFAETNGFTTTVNGDVQTMRSYNDRADSDGDGLPDLLEHLLRTNPQSNDTDGDGLTDYQEFKPSTFDGYNSFVQACAEAKFCTYTPPTGDAGYGTSLLLRDTDGDTLDDKTEATTNWTVSVTGADGSVTPRNVTSSPILANKDGDGWNDAVERANATDPNAADTDGDGSADNLDGARCAGTTCASPLIMDQKITVTFVDMLVRSDGDDGGNPGDFYFNMVSSVPAQADNNGTRIAGSSTVNVRACVNNNQDDANNGPCRYTDQGTPQIAIKDGQTLSVNASQSFIKRYSVAMSLYYYVQELDGDNKAQFTHEFRHTYNRQIVPGAERTGTFNDRFEDSEHCGTFDPETCERVDTDVSIRITVQ